MDDKQVILFSPTDLSIIYKKMSTEIVLWQLSYYTLTTVPWSHLLSSNMFYVARNQTNNLLNFISAHRCCTGLHEPFLLTRQ